MSKHKSKDYMYNTYIYDSSSRHIDLPRYDIENNPHFP